MKITQIKAREIYDSRGWPTVQCEIILDDHVMVSASVPSGLSKSSYEARELRDGGKRLWGKGVSKALESIEKIIAPVLLDKEPNGLEMDLKIIELDGTVDKSYLGANATLAVSMAVYRAQALVEEIELYELIAYLNGSGSVTMPFPFINLINGGMHANNNLQIQEFMVVPIGAENFRASFELSVVIFHELKNTLQKYGKSVAVGDEGGFVNFTSDSEALDILAEVLDRVGSTYGYQCIMGLDIAASRYYDRKTKKYSWNGEKLSSAEMIEFYKELIENYPIFSIEDALSEDDWHGWKQLTEALQGRVQIVGDDVFATNADRIMRGIEEHIADSIIIKPNQIGTIAETIQAIQLCKNNNLNTIVSHRSGETNDTFIADLAVGTSAGQIKAGGCCRGERLAKYNRLLMIEDELMLAFLNT